MEPGKELDRLVLKEIFGIEPSSFVPNPPYSRDMEYAFKIIVHAFKKGIAVTLKGSNDGWACEFSDGGAGSGATPAHAIALAALNGKSKS